MAKSIRGGGVGFVLMLIGAGLMATCARIVWGALADAKALDTRISELAEVPIGDLVESNRMVAVSGNAVAGVGVDPIHGRPVAFSDVAVSAPYAHKVKGSHADVSHRATIGDPLVVEQAGASVRVAMDSVDFRLGDQSEEGEPKTDEQLRFIESTGLPARGGGKHFELKHRWVDASQNIRLIGYVRRAGGGYEFVNDERWQTIVTSESVDEIKAAHNSASGPLWAAMVIFGLFGVLNIGVGLWLLLR